MSFYNYFFCFLLMMLTFSFCNFKPFFTRIPTFMKPAGITVHTPLFREVFWHKYAKIPLPCYVYNLTTGKSKRIDSASISTDLINGKIYYAKCLSSRYSGKGYKLKLYSYNIKNGKKAALSKTFYADYCYAFTSKTVTYRSSGKTYKYTYSTGKSTQIS